MAQVGLVYISPSYQHIRSASFSRFTSGYAVVNNAELSDELNEQPGIGFNVGFGLQATNSIAILGVEYSRAKSAAMFRFRNNAERKFTLHSNLLIFKFMLPIGDVEESPFFGLIDLGAGLGRAVINSTFTQGNTPINSSALDGKYTGFHGEVSAGLSLVYRFGPLGIKASCLRNWSMFPTRLDDQNKDMDYDSLPQDYASYVVNPERYMGAEVKDDFKYFTFSLGVVLVVN